MQWSLFLLILMGQGSFFTCQLYEYHFVNENKTWYEAQTYCRDKYTDLATVYDIKDMKDIKKKLKASTNNEDKAWIGLYNTTDEGKNRTWHWSLPGVEYYADEDKWDKGETDTVREPNNKEGIEDCGILKTNTTFADVRCCEKYAFICYDEKKKNNKTFHVYKNNNKKNWTEAQNYCRVNHTDLISGLSQLKDAQKVINAQIGSTTSIRFWIGLFADTWGWSNGSTSSFRNWTDSIEAEQKDETCTIVTNTGKWVSDTCTKKHPFFCYEDKVILIKQNKTWEEALNYCRDNHYDLVSIINHGEQIYVQEKAKKADSPYVWLGLRYTCTLGFWFWISDEVVDYKNWNGTETTNSCGHAGAMDREGKHKWFKKPDQEKFNFICSMC